jgi:hypothetical protein
MGKFVNAPCCERCWVERKALWAAPVGEPEQNVMVGMTWPVCVKEKQVERCGFCGHPTIMGAYLRVTEDEAPHHVEKPE